MSDSICKSFQLQLITDVNLAVAVEAIQAIGNLARGLRTHFSASSRFMLPVLLVSLVESFIQSFYERRYIQSLEYKYFFLR